MHDKYPCLGPAQRALSNPASSDEIRAHAAAIMAEANLSDAHEGHAILPQQSPPIRDYYPDAGFRAELTIGLGEALCWIGLGAVSAGVVFVLWWGFS